MLLPVVGMFVLVASMFNMKAVTLNLVYDGDPSLYPTNMSDFTNLMNAAAYASTVNFENSERVQTIHVWMSTNTSEGILAQEIVNELATNPDRISDATVLFNANASWFIDPTPYENEEYSNYVEFATNFGGGIINVSRTFTSGPNANDLLSIAKHEFDHVVGGLDENFTPFYLEVWSTHQIEIQQPLPFAGTVIGVQAYVDPADGVTKFNGCTDFIGSYPSVTSGGSSMGYRNLFSDLDIVCMAQIANLSITPKLRISIGGGCVTVTWTQRIGNWQLVESNDLVNWTPSSLCPNIVNGTYTVSTPATGAQKFWKLVPITPPVPALPVG